MSGGHIYKYNHMPSGRIQKNHYMQGGYTHEYSYIPIEFKLLYQKTWSRSKMDKYAFCIAKDHGLLARPFEHVKTPYARLILFP